MAVEHLPINAGDWAPLNDFLAVGHNPDGTLGGGYLSAAVRADTLNGNGTSDVAAALAAQITSAHTLLTDAGLSFVWLFVPKPATAYKINSKIVIPDGVRIVAPGVRFTAGMADYMFEFNGDYASLEGALLEGGGAGVGATGIHVAANKFRNRIVNCTFDQLNGRAVYDQGNGSYIRDCFGQNCLLGADSLVTATGVAELAGTDAWMDGCEWTASRSALSASGKAYGLAITGANQWVSDTVAELSDHGVYLGTGATYCRLKIRADLNRGHGFVIDGGTGLLTGHAVNNSQETTNTYDGFNAPGANASNWKVDGIAESALAKVHRYGVNDQQASGSNWNEWNVRSFGQGTAPITVGTNWFSGHFSFPRNDASALTAASATPSVGGQEIFVASNVGATNVTDFTNGVNGQRISVIGDGQTTVVHNTGLIRCKSGANTLLTANVVFEFLRYHNVWYQI